MNLATLTDRSFIVRKVLFDTLIIESALVITPASRFKF